MLKGHLSGLSEDGICVKGSPVRVIKRLAFMPSCQLTVRDIRGWYCHLPGPHGVDTWFTICQGRSQHSVGSR